MKERARRDFINILQKVSCEHSPQCNHWAFKFSWNIAFSKREKKYFSPVVFLNLCHFLSSIFSYKPCTWERENRSKPLQKLVPAPAAVVCTNTIPCSGYSHSLPQGSEISAQTPSALLWGAGWDTGTGQIGQDWLCYNLLARLHRTVWYLQLSLELLSKVPLS